MLLGIRGKIVKGSDSSAGWKDCQETVGGEMSRKMAKCRFCKWADGWLKDFYVDYYEALKATFLAETEAHSAQSSLWLLMFAPHLSAKGLSQEDHSESWKRKMNEPKWNWSWEKWPEADLRSPKLAAWVKPRKWIPEVKPHFLRLLECFLCFALKSQSITAEILE